MKYLLFSTLIYYIGLNADITGIGFAQTQSESKKLALADLSGNIKSEVRSQFESTMTDTTESSKSNIKVSSNLPILRAEFKHINRALEVETTVNLSNKSAAKLYTKKLKNINSEINTLFNDEKEAKNSTDKLNIYEQIFSLLNEYDRYESVALILNAQLPKRPSITKAQVQIKLANINSNIDSIAMATKVLAKEFKESSIFVYPPLLQNTTTASEFSSVFQKQLKAKLNTTKKLKSSNYLLVGEYTLAKNAMVLNYELLDTKNNEVKKSKTISIKKSAYKNYKVKPNNISFDQLLNSGIASSSNLKVSLNSNRGSENLLFEAGEDVELFVKLNKMGYFYIVGYTQTKEGKMSYLLELSEGMGNSKFVKFVNADDANRWMNLGEFTVEPPYGIESIQVIASNQKITSLPNTKYDEDTGYYIISNDIKKTLATTRGLKKKKSKKKEISEDVMSFTTIR